MKIVFIYQYFCTPKGSWSTRVYEFTRRWQAEGHQVTVITAPYEKTDIKARGLISVQKIEGIKVVVINSGDSNRLSVPLRAFYAILFSVLSTCVALLEKTDVVLASSGPITVAIPALLVKWFKKVPMIFEVRDLWPDGAVVMGKLKSKKIQKYAYWFEKVCYKNARLVVTASVGMESDILSRYPSTSTLVIPNSADIGLFGQKDSDWELPGWATGKKLFLNIGSLGFIHNAGLVIDAAKILSNMNKNSVHIVLIGEGVEREKLESKVKEYALNNVSFLGLVRKIQIVKWLQHANATVFTTLNNSVQDASSPNKVFDSFAAGVPVIQTTNGWIKDLFEKEHCGISVPSDNPKAIAEAMLLLSRNKVLCKRLGENALNLAQTMFNRDLLAEKYLNALDTLHANSIT